MSKIKMHKNVGKEGISLSVLILTITVAIIIISTVIFSVKNVIQTTNVSTFSKDLTQIQDAVQIYYSNNNEIPLESNSTEMSKDELLALSRSRDSLLGELTENNDLESKFYTIDLAKINITKIAYGNKKLGAGDIFVVAYPSMNVYYIYGLESNNKTYFSLTSKISDAVKIYGQQVDTKVGSTNGIRFTQINGWTNKMGVNLEVKMDTDEKLYMSVSGGINRLITTTTGENTFNFNLLSSIVSNTETIKVPSLTIEEANYIELGTKPLADRYVDILKYKGSELIGKVRIDLSNFSKIPPTINNATISSALKENTVELSLGITDSDIKEVRYEYLTKYSNNGTIENYYNDITDFDSVYMQEKAKQAKLLDNLKTIITAPKNVQSIKVILIDKAGNINLYNQEIAPRLYICCIVDSSTKESLQLTANIFSVNGIKSITFSKSTDGINFTDEQVYNLNTTTNGVTSKQCIPYTNISADNVYIKMVAVNYDNSITETRIKNINLTQISVPVKTVLGVNVIATENTTVDGEAASYQNPIIPKGFKAINDSAMWPADWNKGLVIEDASGNQFVWVPVDETNVPYAKWCTSGISYLSTSNDTLPVGVTSETDQITKYGGFYI